MDRRQDSKVHLPTPTAPRTIPAVVAALNVGIKGNVSDEERELARASIAAVLAQHGATVDHPRGRITGPNHAGGPSLIQVNVRVGGAPARIQAAAETTLTAITTATARLQRKIIRLTTAWEPWPWPDPQRPPLGSTSESSISRLKTYWLVVGVPCLAAAYLDAMDYDVFLYTDAETKEDAIVYRHGPTGLRLARQKTTRPPTLPVTLPLTTSPRQAPILTAARAAALLTRSGLPFAFYTDSTTLRGNLLYRRYDGDLGLIAPTVPDPTG